MESLEAVTANPTKPLKATVAKPNDHELAVARFGGQELTIALLTGGDQEREERGWMRQKT